MHRSHRKRLLAVASHFSCTPGKDLHALSITRIRTHTLNRSRIVLLFDSFRVIHVGCYRLMVHIPPRPATVDNIFRLFMTVVSKRNSRRGLMKVRLRNTKCDEDLMKEREHEV